MRGLSKPGTKGLKGLKRPKDNADRFGQVGDFATHNFLGEHSRGRWTKTVHVPKIVKFSGTDGGEGTGGKQMTYQTRYRIRALTAADQPLLWEMLYLSLFVPNGSQPFERSVLERVDISRYVRDWGRATDCGFVAIAENNQPLGAIWLRVFTGDEKGYGYLDELTPELGMAVIPQFRGQNIGTSLLERLVETAAESYEQISLSVARDNPARRLYERLGFAVVAEAGNSLTMRKRLKGHE